MKNPKYDSMPQLFNWPTCGAILRIPETATVKCSYCVSSVVVPPELRAVEREKDNLPSQPAVVQISLSPEPPDAQERRSRAGLVFGCVILGVVLSLQVTGILAAEGIFASTRSVNEGIASVITDQSPPTEVILTIIKKPTELPAPTITLVDNLIMQFGSEGTEPGQFQDARHIVVDQEGNIYVADYDTGRLQIFNPGGKFLQLINVESNQYAYSFFMDMAVDYTGHLFIVRVPDILSYNTSDLSKSQTIPGWLPEVNFRFLVIDPTNHLFAVLEGVQFTDPIKMDVSGEILWTVQGVIFNRDQRANPSVDDIAVEGLGTSYIVNDIDARIYQFHATGKYQDRFGVKGNSPGQLDKPSRIVVDLKGRLPISDRDGIDFFTSEGDFCTECDGITATAAFTDSPLTWRVISS